MTGFGFNHSNSFCCSAAAAGSSANFRYNLDTASSLAVSICVLPLVRVVGKQK